MTAIQEGASEAEILAHRRRKAGSSILFLDGLGFGVVVPLLPFIVLDFGGDPATVTLLVAIYGLASFIGGFVAGELSDRWGRKRLVVAALALSVVAYIGMALGSSLSMLFACRALSGFSTGRDGVLRALVTDGLDRDKHLPALARIIAAYSLGVALGPGIAGLLPVVLGEGVAYIKTLFAIGAVASGIMLVIVQRTWSAEKISYRASIELSRSDRKAAIIAASRWLTIGCLATYAYANVLSVTALFGHEAFGWTAPETGWLLVLVSLGVFVTRSTALPWAARQLGELRALGGAIALGILAAAVSSIAAHPALFVIGVSALTWMMAAVTVMIGSIVSQSAPTPYRGFLMGVSQSLNAAALVIGAVVSGYLFDALGRGAPYAAAAVLLTVAAALVWTRPRLAAASYGR